MSATLQQPSSLITTQAVFTWERRLKILCLSLGRFKTFVSRMVAHEEMDAACLEARGLIHLPTLAKLQDASFVQGSNDTKHLFLFRSFREVLHMSSWHVLCTSLRDLH